jgi:hypothetical protein
MYTEFRGRLVTIHEWLQNVGNNAMQKIIFCKECRQNFHEDWYCTNINMEDWYCTNIDMEDSAQLRSLSIPPPKVQNLLLGDMPVAYILWLAVAMDMNVAWQYVHRWDSIYIILLQGPSVSYMLWI